MGAMQFANWHVEQVHGDPRVRSTQQGHPEAWWCAQILCCGGPRYLHELLELRKIVRIKQLLKRLAVQVCTCHQEVLQTVRDAVDAKVAVQKDLCITNPWQLKGAKLLMQGPAFAQTRRKEVCVRVCVCVLAGFSCACSMSLSLCVGELVCVLSSLFLFCTRRAGNFPAMSALVKISGTCSVFPNLTTGKRASCPHTVARCCLGHVS